MTERGVSDALIIANTQGVDPRVDYLMKLGKPFVTFGRTTLRAPRLGRSGFRVGGRGRGRASRRLGHRKIALALPDRTNYLDLLEAGYRRAMRANGLAVDEGWRRRRTVGERGGIEIAEALLSADPRPTRSSSTIPCRPSRSIAASRKRVCAPGREFRSSACCRRRERNISFRHSRPIRPTGPRSGAARRRRHRRNRRWTEREPEEGAASTLPEARVQFKMPVIFSPGESVHRIDGAG